MTHDGWRMTLPYYIDLYKTDMTTVAAEILTAWYVLHGPSCDIGETTINTATHLQEEMEPVTTRTIFFSAVLASPANVSISVGGVSRPSPWTKEPYGGVGVYHGSWPAGDVSGNVVITLKRGNDVLATLNGRDAGGCGPNGLFNFNPWVGMAPSVKAITPRSPPANAADLSLHRGHRRRHRGRHLQDRLRIRLVSHRGLRLHQARSQADAAQAAGQDLLHQERPQLQRPVQLRL